MLLRARPLIDDVLERHVGAFISQDEMAAVQAVMCKILEGNAMQPPVGSSPLPPPS
jgi:hypothetical protein